MRSHGQNTQYIKENVVHACILNIMKTLFNRPVSYIPLRNFEFIGLNFCEQRKIPEFFEILKKNL